MVYFVRKRMNNAEKHIQPPLVTKLQRYIQEVNRSIEEISQQAVSNLPRVLRDVETLKKEAAFLWQQMQQVKEEIRSVEQSTSHSMEVLVQIDNIRSRVEQASAALKEADNWSSLAAAIEDIFRSGDIEAVASQLQSMHASLVVLKNSPDYDDKVLHLEALKNRLETTVSPSVVSAFMNHSTTEAKKYHTIFKNLDRLTELRNYYLKCHRARVSSKWQEIVSGEIDSAKPGTDSSDISLLSEFYELLLSVWHAEVQWCSVVFGKEESLAIIAQLLLEVTLSVEYGPNTMINNSVTGTSVEKLDTLQQM
uniref:Conserved oligomeric Golgi complex subunit 7 n=1 Tax=Ciona savignyi TaxID=51511 RepID=H2YTE5_CIOSA